MLKLKIIVAVLHKQINLNEVIIMNLKPFKKMKVDPQVQKKPSYISVTLESTISMLTVHLLLQIIAT